MGKGQRMEIENDYISRQAAIEETWKEPTYLDPINVLTEMRDRINEIPSADVVPRSIFEQVKWERDVAMKQLEDLGIGFGEEVKDVVEVVRCKDCKHYYYADNRIPQEQRYVCDLDGDRWKPDSFCSFAERETNEADYRKE